MAVFVVNSVERLGRKAARLSDGDVLAYGAWRIVVAGAGELWVERDGDIRRIKRTRRVGADLRRLVQSVEGAQSAHG